MKQKSIAMVIHDTLFEYAKSPGAEGKPIDRLMHLKRLKKLNGTDTGAVTCSYQYKPKWGASGPKVDLFTVDRRGRITFMGEQPTRTDLMNSRLEKINNLIQSALQRTHPLVRFSFRPYPHRVEFHIDHGEASPEKRAEIIAELRAQTYGYPYQRDWILGVCSGTRDVDKGRIKTDDEVWNQFGKSVYENGHRWEKVCNEGYLMNPYEKTPPVLTLIPRASSGFGYLVKRSSTGPNAKEVADGLLKVTKRQRYFKVMSEEGKTGYAEHVWDLPKQNNGGDAICGDWLTVDGPLRMCRNGIHVCTPDQLQHWTERNSIVVEMEICGAVYTHPGQNKLVCRKARIKRVMGKIHGPEFDVVAQTVGRIAAIELVAKGRKLPTIYTVQAEVVMQYPNTKTFTATSLRAARGKAKDWSGAGGRETTETIIKKKITRVTSDAS